MIFKYILGPFADRFILWILGTYNSGKNSNFWGLISENTRYNEFDILYSSLILPNDPEIIDLYLHCMDKAMENFRDSLQMLEKD